MCVCALTRYWLVRDVHFWEEPHLVVIRGAFGLVFVVVVVGDVHVVLGRRPGARLVVVGRVRVVRVGLPIVDVARGVELLWAEPLERGLQEEDLREPAWRVASTKEAERLGSSFERPRFAEMLRVMCVGVCACYQCISMPL